MLVPRLDPKTERISQLARFATCTLQELGRIAAVGTELDLAAGRIIESRPASRDQILVVLEGTVELVDATDLARVITTISVGGVVGPHLHNTEPTTIVRVGSSGATVLAFSTREVAFLARDVPTFVPRVAREPRVEAAGLEGGVHSSTRSGLGTVLRHPVAHREHLRYGRVTQGRRASPVVANGSRTW